MDAVREVDPTCMNSDDVYVSSEFSIIKVESENIDAMKVESDVDVQSEGAPIAANTDVFLPSGFSMMKAESENIDTMKVENDVDVQSEGDPIAMNTDEGYIPSEFSIIKAKSELCGCSE